MNKYRTTSNLSNQIPYILTSWITAVTIEYMVVSKESRSLVGLVCLTQMSGVRITCLTAFLFASMNILERHFHGKEIARWLMVDAFALYATSAIINSFTWAFFSVCALVMLVLVIYAIHGWDNSLPPTVRIRKENKVWLVLTMAAAWSFFLLVSIWTVARVRSFSAPSFDFGIFSQMFYYMKTTGRQMTTVERDGLLSHFAIHVSPIYYLMLPFYCLFPHPEILQVLQAAVMASAVIPLWKLGKQHGLHPGLRTAVCVLLLLYPAYSGGAGYDLHENCFLTPLILWLLYGIDKKSVSLTAVFAAATLIVKEDAPVYVAVIALYLLLRSVLHDEKWGIITGGVLMLSSIAYFLFVTAFLSSNGEGIMNWRYKNFMYDGSNSLFTVIKAVLLCPMKAVFECVDTEKLEYIGLTMLPLIGLPLITRRYERFIMLIPYILVNLMSDYQYQHDIMFQYSFGSTAFLFYLVVVNLADLKPTWKSIAIIGVALCISLGCFYEEILPIAKRYISKCNEYSEYYDEQRILLDTIPDEASVAATTFYTTYLSQRSLLYDVRYSSIENILDCDYIVIRANDSGTFKKYEVDGANGKENFVAMLLKQGYRLEKQQDGVLEIYRKVSMA